jgi:hypothetical protein
MLILIPCPQCQATAEVLDRFCLESTDGYIEHVVLECVRSHHFRMPADRLPAAVQVLMTEADPAGAEELPPIR